MAEWRVCMWKLFYSLLNLPTAILKVGQMSVYIHIYSCNQLFNFQRKQYNPNTLTLTHVCARLCTHPHAKMINFSPLFFHFDLIIVIFFAGSTIIFIFILIAPNKHCLRNNLFIWLIQPENCILINGIRIVLNTAEKNREYKINWKFNWQ